MSKIFVYPALIEPQDLSSTISRLAWYFKPYLDRIEAIHFTSRRSLVDPAALAPHVDPLVEDWLPVIKHKIQLLNPVKFAEAISRIDPAKDILLLWNQSKEASAPPEVKQAIQALSKRQGFYRVDPVRTRMEGSYYLWAGMNRYADVDALTAQNHLRMKRMAEEIGQHDKAYVFGSGPSLSDFVDSHDFSDGVCVISNSIVKNREIIARTRPRIIAAADPLYHAGCSSYAGAFRDELVHAMRETGAWFVCPMRDFAIYDAFLPTELRERIIGIPFNRDIEAPAHLGETFHLSPYPNILTLALLPLASTVARSIHVVGCDGRHYTDDSFFWSHDQKAQFNDKMAEIQAAHPAFFAINYNDYYVEHCRDVEEVASRLERAGRTIVTETPSLIPALHNRERDLPSKHDTGSSAISTFVMIDPDAKDEWGHFLAYDKRIAEAAQAQKLKVALVCRNELDPKFAPPGVDQFLPLLSVHSWTVGNKWPGAHTGILATFAREMEQALNRIEEVHGEGVICLFMYVGSIEVAEVLEHLLVTRPRVRAVVNLFWSYNFDQTAPAYEKVWRPVMRRLSRSPRIRLTHSTGQIAEEFRRDWQLDFPVLPHPSTTFGDSEAAGLAAQLKRPAAKDVSPPIRVLFPGGTRKEKGFQLSIDAAALLAREPGFQPVLRARLDKVSGAELHAAYEALDKSGIEILDGDLSDAGFIDMIGEADIVVIPYHGDAFRRRTSGILVDAMLLGKPVVVLSGTWLADVVGTELTGAVAEPNAEAILAAVRKAAQAFPTYRSGLSRAAQIYLRENSWLQLVRFVLETAAGATIIEVGALAPGHREDLMQPNHSRMNHAADTTSQPISIAPGEVKEPHVLAIAALLNGPPSKLSILALGSALLTSPKYTKDWLDRTPEARRAMERALQALSEDEELGAHLQKCLDYADRQATMHPGVEAVAATAGSPTPVDMLATV